MEDAPFFVSNDIVDDRKRLVIRLIIARPPLQIMKSQVRYEL